jgi:hypothetical protein
MIIMPKSQADEDYIMLSTCATIPLGDGTIDIDPEELCNLDPNTYTILDAPLKSGE